MRISDWSSDVCSSDLDIVSSGRIASCVCFPVGNRFDTSIGLPPGSPSSTRRSMSDPSRSFASPRHSSADRSASGPGVAEQDRDRKGVYPTRSEEHTSELQSLMRTSYAVFCLKKTQQYSNTSHTKK